MQVKVAHTNPTTQCNRTIVHCQNYQHCHHEQEGGEEIEGGKEKKKKGGAAPAAVSIHFVLYTYCIVSIYFYSYRSPPKYPINFSQSHKD